MPAFKITANHAIALNLRQVLTGVQAGAGIAVLPAVDTLLPAHWNTVIIQNEPTGNSGGFIRVGGVNTPADATSGETVQTGDSLTVQRSWGPTAIGNVVLAVSADSTIINVFLA